MALIDSSARAAGLDIKHDLYPYTASSTGSSVLFPQWALAGGPEDFRSRVDDPETRARIEEEMQMAIGQVWAGSDLGRIQFRTVPSDPAYNGRTIADLAADRGVSNSVESGVQLAIGLQLSGGFTAIQHAMDEADVIHIMRHPFAIFETDGDAVGYGLGFPHPRSYGAFPRVLARYVREMGVIGLEEAIRWMISLSMEQLVQANRGLVGEGMFADLVVYDVDEIRDLATFTDPLQYSVGVVHLLVNGTPVIQGGGLTGERPGRVLKGPARPAR